MFRFLLELLDVPRKHLLCWCETLDSTFFCGKAGQLVSPRLPGTLTSLTRSSLCWSDKLVVGLHLLFSPAGTVVKPA